MLKTITPIDNTIYVERNYANSKEIEGIFDTLVSSMHENKNENIIKAIICFIYI